MCGIAGLMNLRGEPVRAAELIRMAGAVSHRGPDGEGYALLGSSPADCAFHDADSLALAEGRHAAGFAHRRLAIIDLSEAGIQPMHDRQSETWLVHNGEIYNYVELRNELEEHGRSFATATDTEVLLQAWDQWGEGCLNKFNGMWAFALWDTRRRILFCARDRFGIKPLYYAFANGRFAFASEPAALLELDWVSSDPDERAIADYLVHSREDCFEWTFFRQIRSLLPGCVLAMPFDATELPAPRRWWRMTETLSGEALSDEEAQVRFRKLFESAVRLRLRSDVPIGTCLSGGLDSSAVVCVARPWLENKEDQKSYSAVYDASFDEDETTYVDEVVQALGIESHRVQPTGEGLLEDLDRLVRRQGEPFGSTSQYAQMKVFELVRHRGTKVTLDGQGCDEELAGYHYFYPVHFAGLLREGQWSKALRELAAYRALTGAPLPRTILATAAGFLSHREMIRWANRYDPSRSIRWVRPQVLQAARSVEQPAADVFGDLLNRRLYEVFSVSSLPALLRYEDRNSMAFGVEARLPFLDHRLVSYLFSLPADQKIRHGWTKYVMREAMAGIVPERIRLRTDKIGFATPEAGWFRTSVLQLMEREFRAPATVKRGLYDTEQLMALLHRNATGRVHAGRALWRALNLELWFRAFVD